MFCLSDIHRSLLCSQFFSGSPPPWKTQRSSRGLQDGMCSGLLLPWWPHAELSPQNPSWSLNRPSMLSAPGLCTWCFLSVQNFAAPTLSQVLSQKASLTTLYKIAYACPYTHTTSIFYLLTVPLLILFIAFTSTWPVLSVGKFVFPLLLHCKLHESKDFILFYLKFLTPKRVHAACRHIKNRFQKKY